jgi:beta-barrel assembly-enhancing protease
VNVTHWSRRKFVAAAGIAGAASLLPTRFLHAAEPRIVNQPYNNLSEQEEIALGRKFSAAYEKKVEILHNSSIDTYLGRIVRKLGDASQRPKWPYQVKVVNSSVINASAIPGGFLYLQRGLLEFVEDENEMVGALAHEVGHIVARHTTNQLVLNFIARNLLEQVKRNLLLDNDVIAEIIEDLGGPVVMLAQLKYDRDNESEADMLGFYEMLRAGWHPNGLLKFFTRLQQMEKGRTAIDVMLSDHPASADRAEAIREEMRTVKINAPLVEQSEQFKGLKATLKSMPPAPKGDRR